MSDRRQQSGHRRQLRPLLPLLALWLPGTVFLLGLVVQGAVPYTDLLLDPNYSLKIPWYYGLLSNLGVLGWTIAASGAAIGAWICSLGGRPRAASMLAGGAVLSTLLLADDLFQLHSLLEPTLGLPKAAAYLFYLLFALGWLLRQWRELSRTRVALLFAAGSALALSIVVDQTATISGLNETHALLAEDSLKFLGILAWAQYFTLTTVDIVRSIFADLAETSIQTDSGQRHEAPKLGA